MAPLSFADIKDAFDQSLGYIRGDITVLRKGKNTVNYTIALLVGCGCEMLAAGKGDRKHPEAIFADLLPPDDWRVLSRRLYSALRHGLAHAFNTKDLEVGSETFPVCISWSSRELIAIEDIEIGSSPQVTGLGVQIGIQPLAEGLCKMIDQFEEKLRHDQAARRQFKTAYEHDRLALLNKHEAAAWNRLRPVP